MSLTLLTTTDIKDIEKEKFKYTSKISLQGVPVVCVVVEK